MSTLVVLLVIPALLAYGAASDLLTMTISNRLCAVLFLSFPVAAALLGMPALDIVLNIAVGFGVLLVCFGMFAAGWIGGGDAKFAAATATWLGLAPLAPYVLYGGVLGGALTIALLWMKKNPMPAIAARFPWYARLQDDVTGVPYGIALAAAALIVLPETEIWRIAILG